MMPSLMWGVALALVSLPKVCPGQVGDAYRVQGNSILVDRASHWENWIFQNDLVTNLNLPVGEAEIFQLGSDGLRPVYFNRNVNVALTASEFIYRDRIRAGGAEVVGGATAISNSAKANNVLDGNLSTFWEPDTPASFARRYSDSGDFSVDGLGDWELELDLGRLVFADSLTVVFPSGQFEEGQPLKSFAVLASMGERFPFPLGNNLKFSLVQQASTGFAAGKLAQGCVRSEEFIFGGATECEGGGGVGSGGRVELVPVPGTEGRYVQMTFPLLPLDRADWDLDGLPDISGTFLQYIRVKVTGSDLWRDSFLGEGEDGRIAYEALPQIRRGALAYQRRTAGGLLVEIQDDDKKVAREKFEVLPEEKRGPILYYAKEVPRISELQVWARGDNYSLKPEKQAGGSFENGGLGAPELATDGIYDSEWQANTWSPVYLKGTAWYDLGAVFWVDNISVVNKRINQSHQGAFLGPAILISDGTALKPLNMTDRSDFPQLEEGLKWDNIISEGHIDNHDPVVRVFQEAFPRRKIRFLQVRDIDITGEQSGRYGALATVAEIQLYGAGYPVSVWVYSPPIAPTDSRGNFIRQTLPRIAWKGDAVIRDIDPLTGQAIERIEPLYMHPDISLQIQSRTSDQTDSTFTYYEVVKIADAEERAEITEEAYDEIALAWAAWEYWQTLPTDRRHKSRKDDDGDGQNDEDPIDFIDNDGDGLIDEDGKKLRRAPKTTGEKDGELAFVGWSEWSDSYLPTDGLSQAPITSPNPRKFVQLRVNISSENPFKTARIRSLEIQLAPPLSLDLVGELALLSDAGATRDVTDLGALSSDYSVPLGIDPLQPQQFSYFIRASAPDRSAVDGFDEVLIVTPRAARLNGVRLGQVEVVGTPSLDNSGQELTSAVTTRFDRAFAPDADGVLRSEEGLALTQVATESDSIWIRFPSSLNAGVVDKAHTLIEVQFESQIFREGIELTSFIRASDSEDVVFQRVDTAAKDATELVDASTTRISLMDLRGSLIQNLAIPSVFTPNGDGSNDLLSVHFTLLKVMEERPLEVGFFDLSGRLVARAQSLATSGKAGGQSFTWDGKNLSGQLVPPGIYICQITVEADDRDNQLTHVVHVAY